MCMYILFLRFTVRMQADAVTIVNNNFVVPLVMWTRSCRKENGSTWELIFTHFLKKQFRRAWTGLIQLGYRRNVPENVGNYLLTDEVLLVKTDYTASSQLISQVSIQVIVWLVVRLVCQLFVWLLRLLVSQVVRCQFDHYLVGYLVGWFVGRLSFFGLLCYQLVKLLVGWSVRLVACLVSWLVGQFVVWLLFG